ncbi:hypothetical protein LR48_Vigan04g237000 [Vigna angularis]|uniref:Uncharacterized protein n=1 Tax=Phaseolus angularis TaxID=3914 RepID=A0A0L9UHY6_PHAAN|nr:uncharacterized protein HKW66_Vig0096980 [Vigna angularis]KOM42172.1 hypothetical protein LR48_Vigan04g237000 [Vigna angularis]
MALLEEKQVEEELSYPIMVAEFTRRWTRPTHPKVSARRCRSRSIAAGERGYFLSLPLGLSLPGVGLGFRDFEGAFESFGGRPLGRGGDTTVPGDTRAGGSD